MFRNAGLSLKRLSLKNKAGKNGGYNGFTGSLHFRLNCAACGHELE